MILPARMIHSFSSRSGSRPDEPPFNPPGSQTKAGLQVCTSAPSAQTRNPKPEPSRKDEIHNDEGTTPRPHECTTTEPASRTLPFAATDDQALSVWPSKELARIMHKFSTAPTKSSAPPALHDPQAGTPGLLNVPYSTFAGADPQAGAPARGATHPGRRFRRFVTRTYA